MRVFTKKMALITGMTLGLMTLPVAHGDGEGMTVLMNGNFATADPGNITTELCNYLLGRSQSGQTQKCQPPPKCTATTLFLSTIGLSATPEPSQV